VVLDEVGWHPFHHAYGSSGYVPGLLRALSAPDPERASTVLGTLRNKVRHQVGGSSARQRWRCRSCSGWPPIPPLTTVPTPWCWRPRAGRRNHFGVDPVTICFSPPHR
jgi:hypothetical protein